MLRFTCSEAARLKRLSAASEIRIPLAGMLLPQNVLDIPILRPCVNRSELVVRIGYSSHLRICSSISWNPSAKADRNPS